MTEQLISLLQKWLREEHGIHVNPTPYRESADHSNEITGYYVGTIYYTNGDCYNGVEDSNYSTYEEALEAGLQEALKLIK